MFSSSDGKTIVISMQTQRQCQGYQVGSEGQTGLSTKTNADARLVLGRTHCWSFLLAHVRLAALRLVLLFAMMFHAVALGSAWSQPASNENYMKAAFLFHFAQLVEWPVDAFDRNGSSLFLCTLEDDAFYDELENTVEGKQVGSRTIRIRHIHFSQATRGCNMVFISKRESKSFPFVTLQNLPVLTVGEADDFLSSGGMIRFHLAENRIRFDINLEAADSSHLKISSRLLLLANSVTRGSSMDNGR